jgi:hypothetical protein
MGSPCPNSLLEDSHGTDREASYTFDPEILDGVPEEKEPIFASAEAEKKWEKRQQIKESRYNAKRRRSAQAALETGLAGMPHDRMVFVLREVETSEFQHPDAREEAARRLVEHASACSACQAQ